MCVCIKYKIQTNKHSKHWKNIDFDHHFALWHELKCEMCYVTNEAKDNNNNNNNNNNNTILRL